MWRQLRDVSTVEFNSSRGGPHNAGDGIEQRRFSCAVRADDRTPFTAINAQRYVIDSFQRVEPDTDMIKFEDNI